MTGVKLRTAVGPRLTAVNLLHHRHPRRGLSLWLVVALLFMQIATSAYACPGGVFMAGTYADAAASGSQDDDGAAADATHHGHHPRQPGSSAHDGDPQASRPDGHDHAAVSPEAAAAALSPDMVDCDMSAGLDADSPQLCKLHCEPGSQTPLHASASTDAPVAPLLWAVLDWSSTALLPQQQGHLPRLGVASGAPPPGAPPLYLSLLVLRN